MKKLCFKIFVVLLLAVIANQLLFSFIKMPFAWGSFYEKEYCIEHNPAQYNTVLLGSSRIGRQIDPLLFDSLNASAINTHSFNFGIDAMSIDESEYLFNHILSVKDLKIKYMLVELSDADVFADANLHTLRKKYYYSPAIFAKSITCLWHSEYPMLDKCRGSFSMTVNFIEVLLKFNLLGPSIDFIKNQQYAKVACSSFFTPLNSNDTSRVLFSGVNYANPHLEFMKHPQEIDTIRAFTKKLFSGKSEAGYHDINKPYLDIVNRMIKAAEEKHIKLIFFLPPKLEEIHYKNVLPVYFALNRQNRIELADPERYPEFYELKYTFDAGHVNKEGAEVLTQKLSSKFTELAIKTQ